jgi:hypothetical protein
MPKTKALAQDVTVSPEQRTVRLCFEHSASGAEDMRMQGMDVRRVHGCVCP